MRLAQRMAIGFAQKFGVVLAVASSVVLFACDAAPAKGEWAKHAGAAKRSTSMTAIRACLNLDGGMQTGKAERRMNAMNAKAEPGAARVKE